MFAKSICCLQSRQSPCLTSHKSVFESDEDDENWIKDREREKKFVEGIIHFLGWEDRDRQAVPKQSKCPNQRHEGSLHDQTTGLRYYGRPVGEELLTPRVISDFNKIYFLLADILIITKNIKSCWVVTEPKVKPT